MPTTPPQVQTVVGPTGNNAQTVSDDGDIVIAPGGKKITPQGGAVPTNGKWTIPDPLYDRKLFTRRDKWREYYNPLWQLSIPMVVARLQASQLGILSDLQWIYRFIERRNPTMIALIARRKSALEKLDWDVKATPETNLPEGSTKEQAEAQRVFLRNAYDKIDNIKGTIGWLAKATFRGYAHLEKHYDADGNICHFEPVPQWNWARDGLFGSWWYNKMATSTFGGGGGTIPIEETDFLIREVEYPIDEVAVIAFVRKQIALRDWDSFLANYGIPPLFVEMPADVPPELQEAYQAAAERVASDSRGTLPFGATIQTVPASSRTNNPQKEHVDFIDTQIVLAGTGGKLTMLTESGSGQLAGGAHSDTFGEIALAEAIEISEVLQKQFDEGILKEQFPDQPILAYFEIAAKEQEDTGAIITNIMNLGKAGYAADLDQLQEITGLKLSFRQPTDPKTAKAFASDDTIQAAPQTENRAGESRAWQWIKNRFFKNAKFADKTAEAKAQEALVANTAKKLSPIQAAQLKALANRYRSEVLTGDETTLKNRSDAFMKTLPAELKKMALSPQLEKLLTDAYGAALLNGAAQKD
jgi:phage gp29-like protein